MGLLAIDIGAQDLFLDVHHMALHYKEHGLSAEAARKVDECLETDEYDEPDDESEHEQSGTIQRFMKHVRAQHSESSRPPLPPGPTDEANTDSTLRIKNL